MIDKDLLAILVCPKCKSEVELHDDNIVCKNSACGLKYPVKDDIPIMLIDEAEE